MKGLNVWLSLWLALFSLAASAQAVRELPDFTRLVDDQGNAVVNIREVLVEITLVRQYRLV